VKWIDGLIVPDNSPSESAKVCMPVQTVEVKKELPAQAKIGSRIPHMERTLVSILALLSFPLALVSASYVEVPAAKVGLLPTQALARQVRALQRVPDSDADVRRRVLLGKAVRDRVDEFIVRQLESLPSISGDQLQHQLQNIVCTEDTHPCDENYSTPKVFTEGWGSKTERRQVVVAYVLYLGFMGPRGSIVTVESYVWEKQSQKARMTSRGGSEFDGRHVEFQQLAWYPSDGQYWIFVSGPPLGWSGRAYAGKATLYSIGIEDVHAIWTSGTQPNLRVRKNELGWEASYANYDRFYNNLPKPYVFDVYKFDYDSRNFQRVIHYPY
jgi:hypothetical protein